MPSITTRSLPPLRSMPQRKMDLQNQALPLFGDAAHNAYSTIGDITDAVGEVYEGVSMGADFVTPDAETTELFVNGRELLSR